MSSETGYLRHFINCNRFDAAKYAPFFIGDRVYGNVAKELAVRLPAEMDFFEPYKSGIQLATYLDTFAMRSDALAGATSWLSARFGRKPRKEMYPVIAEWGDAPLAQIDRIAVPWFGVRGFGIHVNGYVRKDDGIHLWIGERASDRLVDPGKLDNMIGGGQPIGLSLEENLCKEAAEEAGLSPALAKTGAAIGQLRYQVERSGGLRNDVLFIYDLEMPSNVIPRNTDGEVAQFHLMAAADVAGLVRNTDRFKFNCNLVIIDFLVRHGLLVRATRNLLRLRRRLPLKSKSRQLAYRIRRFSAFPKRPQRQRIVPLCETLSVFIL